MNLSIIHLINLKLKYHHNYGKSASSKVHQATGRNYLVYLLICFYRIAKILTVTLDGYVLLLILDIINCGGKSLIL